MPLPHAKVEYISPEHLKQKLESRRDNCSASAPQITILDFRNEVIISPDTPPLAIKTPCPSINLLMDDLLVDQVLEAIPRTGLLVTVTETGNRDAFAIRHLSRFGFTNIKALEFGMRGWIKNRFPVK